ncbi:MAG: electron transfer flavoprotein subunit alpha/FixB family protein [bacterium]
MPGGILVVAEHLKGELKETTFELLALGRRLAEGLGAPLYSVVMGEGASGLAAKLGAAQRVFVSEGAGLSPPVAEQAAAALKSVVEKKDVAITLVAGTNVWMGVEATLAAFLSLPLVNFCTNCRIENGQVVFTSKLFGGKILADVRLPENRGVVSVNPGSFSAKDGEKEGSPAVEALEAGIGAARAVFREYVEPEAGDVDITKQDVLVSVGRGIQSKDNIEMAETIAHLLGGAVSASRPVVDQGWLPLTRQVGKSGMIVKPKLYLALGISGAPEHAEGMKGAKLIVAINSDAKAPIFEISHYGICGDLFEIVPALTEAIESRKQVG